MRDGREEEGAAEAQAQQHKVLALRGREEPRDRTGREDLSGMLAPLFMLFMLAVVVWLL